MAKKNSDKNININIDGDAQGTTIIVGDSNVVGQGSQKSDDIKSRFLVPFPHNPDFVGRDEELSSLHEMLQQKQSIVGIRPTVLVGLGGIGKTQLAVEYAHVHREDYPSGIFWLNAIEPLANEFARLAKQLELANADTPLTIAAQRCCEYLDQHANTLVVFDNVEEPSSLNVPFAEGLIASNLKCATLFTTRKRDFPPQFQPFEVKTLPEVAAMQLLLKHPSRQPILESNHPDHGLARVICITLGYLPLALALASAYLGKHSKISLYDYRVRILEEGAMDVVDATQVRLEEMPTRHQTAVNATLKTSWDAITDENARLAFRAAGQFRQAEMIPNARLGLVTGLAMESKPGYPVPLDEALEILHTASLIEELDESRQRLRLHPLVREFAAQLSLPEFRLDMAERVATTFNDLARLHERVAKYGVDFVLEDARTGVGFCESEKQGQDQPQQFHRKHSFFQTLSEFLTCFVSTKLSIIELQPTITETQVKLSRLERVLGDEAHYLRDWDVNEQPSFLLQNFRNRALVLGYDELLRRAEAQLTDWKLGYLRERFPVNRVSNELVRTLEGHLKNVWGVAVSADGRWAVSASADHTLKVWDLMTGECVRTLEGHLKEVWGVAVTGDGRWAVSASADHTLKVWDLTTGECVRALEGHLKEVWGVAVTADGRWAVSESSDDTLKVWDLTTGQCVRTLEGHGFKVRGVAVSADGRWAVSASDDLTLKVWNLSSGQCVRTLKGHRFEVCGVAVTADGRWAVSASKDKTLKVWNLSSGQCVRTLEGHTDYVRDVAVTTDGRWAVSASDDLTLKVWNLSSGQCVRTLEGHGFEVCGVAVSTDGRGVVSASADQTLKVWDISTALAASPWTKRYVRTLERHSERVNSVAVTADGQWAVSASKDKTLKVWDLLTGQCIRTLEGHTQRVSGIAVTPDGRWAVSASSDMTLKVWDLVTGQCVRTLEGHTLRVNGVAVTADGHWAVSASEDNTLRVWDISTGQCIRTLKAHSIYVDDVAVTADGRWVVSAAGVHNADTLKVWDLATGQCVRTLNGHGGVLDVAVAADGQWMVSASSNHTLEVWDISTGHCIRTLEAHTHMVNGVVITADGHWVVSASSDTTLKVWDITTGQCVLTLLGVSPFLCCAVAPDGKTIVAGDEAGAVHFIEWVKFDS